MSRHYQITLLATVLITIFSVQLLAQVQFASAEVNAYEFQTQQDATEAEQRIYQEGVKIVIGCPDQVDTEDWISVYIAGIRNAKARYISPANLMVELIAKEGDLGIKDQQGDLSDRDIILSTKKGWREDDGLWSIDSTVEQLDNDFVFQAKFRPLQINLNLRIKVTMTWLAPWHEYLVTSEMKKVAIADWRNYSQYLQTDYDFFKTERIDDTAKLNEEFYDITLPLETNLTTLFQWANDFNNMNIIGFDPASTHFYILNISNIVNTDISSGSYLANLYTKDIAKYNEYVTLLDEINSAFQQSLEYISKKFGNSGYTITYVNTTYEGSPYASDSLSIWDNVNGVEDSDIDDEHLIDASFEFLTEGQFWSSSPSLIHDPRIIYIGDQNSGTSIDINGYKDQYSSYFENQYGGDWYLTDLDIYAPDSEKSYVRAYSLDAEYNIIGSVPVTIDESTDSVQFDDDIVNGVIFIEPKGGYTKIERSIIVNLMGDIFPLLNRIYTLPRGRSDMNYTEAMNQLMSGANVDLPCYQCTFIPNATSGIDVSSINYVIDNLGTNAMNITDVFLRYKGLSQGEPFFINTFSKPFGNMVYDSGYNPNSGYYDIYQSTHKDQYDSEYDEFELTRMLDFFEPNFSTDYTFINNESVITFFQLIDGVCKITDAENPSGIYPIRSKPYEYFYKNRWANWIDAFFNGTKISSDMVTTRDDSYVFRWIDTDVLSGVDISYIRSDYSLAPFQGPSNLVPIGIFSLGTMDFIQNSMENFTQGFGYAYGLIYNMYYRIYYGTLNMYIKTRSICSQQGNLNAVQNITREINDLMPTWNNNDYPKIYEHALKAIKYSTDPSYTSTESSDFSPVQQMISDTVVSLDRAKTIAGDMMTNGKSIDDALDESGVDSIELDTASDLNKTLDTIYQQILVFNSSLQMMISESGFFLVGDYEINDIDDLTSNRQGIIENMSTYFAEKGAEFINKTVDSIGGAVEGLTHAITDNMREYAENEMANQRKMYSVIGFSIGVVLAMMAGYFYAHTADVTSTATVSKFASGACIAVIMSWIGAGIVTKVIEEVKEGDGFDASQWGEYFTPWSERDLAEATKSNIDWAEVGDSIDSTVSDGLEKTKVQLSAAFNTVIAATGRITDNIVSALRGIFRTFASVANVLISQALGLVRLLQSVITMVSEVLETVSRVLNDTVARVQKIFNSTLGMITTIVAQMKTMIGRPINTTINLVKGVFNQVSEVISNLKNSSAFSKGWIDSLFQQFNFAQIYSSFSIQKRTEAGHETDDTLELDGKTLQSLSLIEQADKGFYLYQMGNEFTDKLYFVTEFRGERVNIKSQEMAIEMVVNSSEFFGVYGFENAPPFEVAKAFVPLQQAEDRYGNPITGVYYIDVHDGLEVDWFRNVTNNPADKRTFSVKEGKYLTFINVTFDTANNNVDNITEYVTPGNPTGQLSAYWAETTKLFNKEYTQDAFVVIDLMNDNDPQNPMKFVAGDEIPLTVQIKNEMYSAPNVLISISLTSDTGTPISQSNYPQVQLNPEGTDDEGNQIQPLVVEPIWTIGRYTPEGNHLLLITVTEANGEMTTYATTVYVQQADDIVNFMFSLLNQPLYLVALIGAVAGSFIGLYFYFRSRSKTKKELVEKAVQGTAGNVAEVKTSKIGIESRCTIGQAELGMCELNGDAWCKLDDLEHGTCQIPLAKKGDWKCDPETHKCHYEGKTPRLPKKMYDMRK